MSVASPVIDRGCAPGRGALAARRRAIALAVASGLVVSAAAVVLLPVALVTFRRARRVYAFIARVTGAAVLRLYGIRVAVHGRHLIPTSQVVYVSNHTSTLDLFVLVTIGLPRTRFFMSGFLRKFVPLGIIAWVMGTFFTVPQDRPAERTRIFQRADRILRRTRESVYLSPEGGRVAAGTIGHFNKGAFHLATTLKAPVVPLFIHIPPDVDPRLGYDARPGTVHVHVQPAIDTRSWRIEELAANAERVRARFLRLHEELRCA